MQDPHDERIVEAIYDALDRGDPGEALDLVERALEREPEEDPVLLFLGGCALLELDRPDGACELLSRAVSADPEDAEFRANLSFALFRACRFEEAALESRRAIESDRGMPDAHAVHALVLERQGRFPEADEHFAKAAAIDPDGFPFPVRISRAQFEAEVARAADLLPARFRRLLSEVAVTVEDLPSEEILREERPPLDPELLGLFVGLSLPERSSLDTVPRLPPRILLFQRNLERHTADLAELRKEIAITVYHELGHYLGLDEDDLEELDLG